MDDHDKTKEQLVAELAALRQQLTALQESEERYRNLAETVPQLMVWTDANRATIQYNRRWYEYTGQNPRRGPRLWVDEGAAPRRRGTSHTTEQRESGTPGGPYEVEYRLRRASDGNYRWHLARSMPMKDKGRQGHRLVR